MKINAAFTCLSLFSSLVFGANELPISTDNLKTENCHTWIGKWSGTCKRDGIEYDYNLSINITDNCRKWHFDQEELQMSLGTVRTSPYETSMASMVIDAIGNEVIIAMAMHYDYEEHFGIENELSIYTMRGGLLSIIERASSRWYEKDNPTMALATSKDQINCDLQKYR
jgi:hypothetical protein